MFAISFNHVGVTVGDLDTAVPWYVDVLGLQVLVPATEVTVATPGLRDVFGPDWAGMRIAHLQVAGGGGLELYEFLTPRTEPPAHPFAYWQVGLSHLSFTVEDLDEAVARVVGGGGRARTAIHEPWPGRRFCYCEDPWGTQIELASVPYADLVGGG